MCIGCLKNNQSVQSIRSCCSIFRYVHWLWCFNLGGGGRRNLVVVPPDLHGYSGQLLKAVSGNGKSTLYISPLQEELNTSPLPLDAKEFEKMPKAQCTTCGKMVPLQILPAHVKECKVDLLVLSSSAEEVSHSCFTNVFGKWYVLRSKHFCTFFLIPKENCCEENENLQSSLCSKAAKVNLRLLGKLRDCHTYCKDFFTSLVHSV